MSNETSAHIADPKRRMLVNARGADQVVRLGGTDGSRELELLRAPDSDRTTSVLDKSEGRTITPVARE